MWNKMKMLMGSFRTLIWSFLRNIFFKGYFWVKTVTTGRIMGAVYTALQKKLFYGLCNNNVG